MGRRILITGGAGFIGSHLAERLDVEGHEVYLLDDLSRGRREWLLEDLPLYQVDLCDAESLSAAIDEVEPDAVVHLAALHFIPAVDDAPELAWRVNVSGTEMLLRVLSQRPPELLVFSSTAAVYPDRPGRLSETCPVAPVDLYGETKVAAEKLVAGFGAQTGTRCIIARLFNVIGRRETNPHVVPELVAQLRNGATHLLLGNLHTRRDYTNVVDVADALARLLERTSGDGVFNVGSGCGVSVAELVALCERILGRDLTVEVDPTRVRDNDRNELVADVALLRSATGWSPERSLEQTLAELLGEG